MHYSVARSDAGVACAKVQTHGHMSRGMCSSLGTCPLLLRSLKIWGEMQVENHVLKSRNMCTILAHGHTPAKHSEKCRGIGT